MTSSPLRHCQGTAFRVSRSLRRSPHANEILMLGIDVGKLHVQEHQDLQRSEKQASEARAGGRSRRLAALHRAARVFTD